MRSAGFLLLVLLLAVAVVGATAGADIVDLLACGSDCGAESAADEEGTCDHCPSCFVSHGHMVSTLADAREAAEQVSTRFCPAVRHRALRLTVQDIFHPPIALAA